MAHLRLVILPQGDISTRNLTWITVCFVFFPSVYPVPCCMSSVVLLLNFCCYCCKNVIMRKKCRWIIIPTVPALSSTIHFYDPFQVNEVQIKMKSWTISALTCYYSGDEWVCRNRFVDETLQQLSAFHNINIWTCVSSYVAIGKMYANKLHVIHIHLSYWVLWIFHLYVIGLWSSHRAPLPWPEGVRYPLTI